jgi:hypothetical protein
MGIEPHMVKGFFFLTQHMVKGCRVRFRTYNSLSIVIFMLVIRIDLRYKNDIINEFIIYFNYFRLFI